MHRGWLIGFLLLVFGTIAAYVFIPNGSDRPPIDPGGDVPIVVKESNGPKVQNWTADDRKDFYHLAEGSELYPLAWVKALVSAKTGKPFLEMPERFGLIADPNDPDGLPIGVSAHESRGVAFLGRMIGVNCAACHVGKVTYGGKSVILDGAPNLFDLNNFYLELFASVGETAKDPKQLAAFMARMEKVRGEVISTKARTMIEGLAAVIRKGDQGVSDAEKSFADQSTALFVKVKGDLKAEPAELLGLLKSSHESVKARFEKLNADAIDRLAQTIESGDLAKTVMNDVAAKRAEIRDSISEMAVNAALIQARLEFLKKLAKMHANEKIIPGPGRIDAFGSIRDMVMPEEDNIPTTSPVNYPHLWQVRNTVWLHWDGNTNSLMQRNVGQSMGLGAVYDPSTRSSTVLPYELYRLDELTRVLDAPAWPAIFPPIDTKRAERGKAIYAKHCLSCHTSPDNPDEKVREQIIDLAVIKTDPTRVENFAIPVERQSGRNGNFAEALRKAAAGFTDQAYVDNGIPKSEQAKMDLPVDQVGWRTNHGYVSRPLVAIWGTAPFLHNGSVPTIHDLLQPADKRPKSFIVGHREYDPVKLGYVSEKSKIPAELLGKPPLMEYDATIKGNLNSGHEYGVSLSDEDKINLLEYLKAS
jgi:hypothetical protein